MVYQRDQLHAMGGAPAKTRKLERHRVPWAVRKHAAGE